ncbi:hypothetical protein [Lysinibacillus parviboronicapiens]|uniref:hypothetical protein n=1 Tax=Lysinibacillus parviboronicapiens TaxID=436516 RepID=UPI003F490684
MFCWSIYSLLVKHYAGRLPGQSTFLVTIFIRAVMLLPFYIYESMTLTNSIHWQWSTIAAIL